MNRAEILALINKNENDKKAELEKENYNKKIQQAALDLQLEVIKYELDSLPDSVRRSNNKLYKNELKKSGIDSEHDV